MKQVLIPTKSGESDIVDQYDKSASSVKSSKEEPLSFGMRTKGGTGKAFGCTGQNYEKLRTSFIQEMRR